MTAVLASEAAIAKIDRKITDLWRSHGRILPAATVDDYARLWRQIDALLDKRLDITA